jgi:NAD-dependent SIR2 family protein deacetylase
MFVRFVRFQDDMFPLYGTMDAVTSTAPSTTAAARGVDALRALVDAGGVVVLSGAGLSTDSGIPDYRGPSGALRRHAPMQYASFVGDPAARHRYWARSYLGWRSIATARPNSGHRAIAALQAGGRVEGIVTQNVDGLHQAAGALDVIELHGGLDRVVCLDCDARESRFALDARLRAANPGFDAHVARVNPDGDVDLPDDQLSGFRMVGCARCEGDRIKPDVVFFGENVPKPRVEHCFALVDRCRALLVVGSSLTVMSGFRFARRAAKLGIPVAIVNQGPTRGDELAAVRVDAPLGEVLPVLV